MKRTFLSPALGLALLAFTATPATAQSYTFPGGISITLMVDDVSHLDLLERVGSGGGPVRVALDVDAGLHLSARGRRAHVGPKRSPLLDVDATLALAAEVLRRPGLRLVGAMSYEGQVAGVPDDLPGVAGAARSAVVRRLKAASLRQLPERRARVAAGLAELGVSLELWNAGGSGSVGESAADPVVTEVAAGSGLLVPGLFDHYRSFVPRPAAFFGLPVTRRPDARTATVHGGGLVASGAAGTDRLPTPWAPEGLALTGLEGAGEVQTPLVGPGAAALAVGDRVWFRHAKSGELFEHGTTVHLVSGDRVVEEVPTYRGLGLCF